MAVRRSWGVVAILVLAVLLQAAPSFAFGLAYVAVGNLNPLPPEDAMLAQAQKSIVTVNVIGDHFKASGSGFFIDGSGDILTNYHVIENAWVVTVTTQSGTVLTATERGTNLGEDVAELHVSADMPSLPLRPFAPDVGEQVYVLGNPGGSAPNSTSPGRVLAVNRSEVVEGFDYTHMATTDAAVQPGSSGSAVIDQRGRVVGMLAVSLEDGGGFIVDSTFAADSVKWKSWSPWPFFVPDPSIEVADWNWTGKYCNPGCGMTATVSNEGGPGKATVTFEVLAANKTTVLATCRRPVSLLKGDKTTVTCTVVSQALINYWNDPSHTEVFGDVNVDSVSPIPVT